MRWVEFSVRADGETAEAVADLFSRYGHGGVSVEEVDPPEMRIGPQTVGGDGRTVRVAAYVPDDNVDHVDAVRQQFTDGLGYLAMIRPLRGDLMERTIADEDWSTAWRDHFHVHRPGARTVVVPTWREFDEAAAEDIVVHLDPGMAFGTGLHPSTGLCIRELERRVHAGDHVLDVGTGSGILSIVAAKLGADRVYGYDIDPVAIRVAGENLIANGISPGMIQIEEGSPPRRGQDPLGVAKAGWPEGGFDIVVANLTAEVLSELAQALGDAPKPGGILIGSGIIADRFSLAVDALTDAGLRLIDATSEGDWRAIVLRRPDRSGRSGPAE